MDEMLGDLGAVAEWLEEHLDGDYARILLEDNPARLIRGEPMVPAE